MRDEFDEAAEEGLEEFLKSDSFKRMKAMSNAEDEARQKAGIFGKPGEVTYTCPLCGGTCYSVRYPHKNELHGRMRCDGCGYAVMI